MEGNTKTFKAIPAPLPQMLLNFSRKKKRVVGSPSLKGKLHLCLLENLHVANTQPFHKLLIVFIIDICNEDFN